MSQAKAHPSKIWFASFPMNNIISAKKQTLQHRAQRVEWIIKLQTPQKCFVMYTLILHSAKMTICPRKHAFRHRMLSETTTALQRAADAIAKLSIHAAVRLPSLQHRPTMPCCSIQRATRQVPLLTQTVDDSSISSSRHLACCASSDVTE